jgi:hypothetical protein
MQTHIAADSMNATTAEVSRLPAESAATQKSLLAQVNTSASEHGKVTPSLFGGGLSTPVGKLESTAPYSEMKASTAVQTLSDRLTPSLISAGLVCGIIPTSMRREYGQLTLDSVLRPQVGGFVEKQKAGC